MVHLLRFFIFLLIFSKPIFAESLFQFASPVFEELVANQIISVRRRLIENKVLNKGRIFLITNQKMGEQITLALKKVDPSVSWDSIVFLTEEPKTLLSKTTENDMVVAFRNEEEDLLQSELDKLDFELGVSFTVPELEYAKDEKGRQIINLGEARLEQAIFERLVREGMNPVLAHPQANEALHQLREMKDVNVHFFFRKNLINQLKNLDFQ